MDQISTSQVVTIVAACVVSIVLLVPALAMILGERRERPLTALCGGVIQARRTSGRAARWAVAFETQRRADGRAAGL